MVKYNMPHEKERSNDSGNKPTNSGKLYKPLPLVSGAKVNNEVFIPLFDPSKWKMFNPTPEQVAKYSMVGDGTGLIAIPKDLASFYLRLSVHSVQNYQRLDGSEGFAYTICPHKMNEYLVNTLGFGPMFDTAQSKCAFCEKEQEWWGVHNQRWEELGYSPDMKKTMSRDDYTRIVGSDAVLNNSREAARKMASSDRYVVQIFDHSKITGARPLDEGQASVEYQLWFAPKGIFDKLTSIYDFSKEAITQGNEVAFFDTTAPNGVNILTLIKDTTECSGNNLMRTKYDLLSGKKYQYSPEWLGYLNNMDAMVDPSDFVFFMNYADGLYLLGNDAKAPAMSPPVRVAVPSVPTPPTPPQMPAASPAPPVSQVSTFQATPLETPLETPPVPAAPPVPQAAAPAAPPVPMQAPTPAAPPVPMQAPTPQAAAPMVPPVPMQAPIPQIAPVAGGAPVMPAPPITPDKTPPIAGKKQSW